MLSRLARHVSYANIVATIALCLAIGGGSAYAAVRIAKNSVGSKQIRDHSIKARDLANSLAGKNGLKGDQGPAGPAGAPGAAGPAGKDLDFHGVRLGKAVAYTADRGFQFTPEVVLGKAGSADIIGKCYSASDSKPHLYIILRRPAGAAGDTMVVFGGTDSKGYATVAPGANYVLVDDTQNPQPYPAYQWAATVVELGGDTYDVRGFVYRTASQCFLPEAQVEDATR